jgi:tRNA uridine 5-carboxymethylaminomethyl modification enzyme
MRRASSFACSISGRGRRYGAPRAQADSQLYTAALTRHLEACPNLTIVEGGVEALLSEPVQNGAVRWRATGVALDGGRQLTARAVIIAAGTFMRGLMHTGERQTAGGRVGEAAANGISGALQKLGLELGRLKTGTPPRLARDSIDFDRLVVQAGDADPAPFSFMTDRIEREQVCCWLTETTPAVHDAIRANLERAPLYCGQIESTGPRYCPSIETKILRFPDKTKHQVFLEPEGLGSDRIYPNGISTSLPQDVQLALVHGIPGLERAEIRQWGYAVEYDFVPPEQIDATLMAKRVAGLFLAGQINGTSGYEEAAGQGQMAGINAARYVAGQPAVVLGRDEAYVGVMIDDLVTRGVVEPYRMFTSRAEHRMHLRYDNADERLTPLGRELGLVDDARWERYQAQQAQLAALSDAFQQLRWEGRPLADWLKRPEEDGERFLASIPGLEALAQDRRIWSRALVRVKYAGYLARQRAEIERFRAIEQRTIPTSVDFRAIPHLRQEARDRWSAVRPRNLGQAARVSGIHATDISLLTVYLTGHGTANAPAR